LENLNPEVGSARAAEVGTFYQALQGLPKDQLERITSTSSNDDEIEAAYQLIDELNGLG